MADSPAPATSIVRKVAEFYTIALAQLDDGELSVAMTATTVAGVLAVRTTNGAPGRPMPREAESPSLRPARSKQAGPKSI